MDASFRRIRSALHRPLVAIGARPGKDGVTLDDDGTFVATYGRKRVGTPGDKRRHEADRPTAFRSRAAVMKANPTMAGSETTAIATPTDRSVGVMTPTESGTTSVANRMPALSGRSRR